MKRFQIFFLKENSSWDPFFISYVMLLQPKHKAYTEENSEILLCTVLLQGITTRST